MRTKRPSLQSIDVFLVERGELKPAKPRWQSIKNWAAANPLAREELLDQIRASSSFELPLADPGAARSGRSAYRSLRVARSQVDPRYVPLGAPVFLRLRYRRARRQ